MAFERVTLLSGHSGEIRGLGAHLSLLLFPQAFLHRIRQNVADSVEKGLTEENVKVWIAGPAPLPLCALLSTAILSSSLLCARPPGVEPAENPFPSAPGSLAPPAALSAALARAPAPGIEWRGRAVEQLGPAFVLAVAVGSFGRTSIGPLCAWQRPRTRQARLSSVTSPSGRLPLVLGAPGSWSGGEGRQRGVGVRGGRPG